MCSSYKIPISIQQWLCLNVLPTGSEEKGVLGVGSIPVTILLVKIRKLPHYNGINNDIVG